jgi:hypothetical protein
MPGDARNGTRKETTLKLRSIVAVILAAYAMGGCADASSSAGDGSPGIDHPTGADQLVFGVEDTGGFVAPSTTLVRLPIFSLFGDGTQIEAGAETEIYPGSALPPILERSISESGVQAILQAALDAGLDHDVRFTDLGSVGIADATTTVFTLTVDGVTHRTEIYALSMPSEQPDGMSDEEWHTRTTLAALVTRLAALDAWLPAGSLGGSEPFRGSRAEILVSPYQRDDGLTEPPVQWPLDASLASIGDPTIAGPQTRCAIVTAGDWASLVPDAESANELTPWVDDGVRYAIAFRPLLPDEPGCAAAG